MPYDRNTYFNPSTEYRKDWSLVPQILTLEVDSQKTSSFHSSLSSILPIFVIFTLIAIALDFFLGFKFLLNQGVGLVAIILIILADWFLAVIPYIFAQQFDKLNAPKIENSIFLKELQCKAEIVNETADEYSYRKALLEAELGDLRSSLKRVKSVRWILHLAIVILAGWKIFSFMSVLPPGMGIFSLMNGKIVIMAATLCAALHIIASEKAFAYLKFMGRKNKELAIYRKTNSNRKPESQRKEIEYKGNFKEAKSWNTSLVKIDNIFYIEYIHIIWDDEINDLIKGQTDLEAKRAVAIKCKEIQLL